MSSRVQHLARIGEEKPEQRDLPGRKLLLAARPVHDERRLEVDGGVLEHDQFAPALAAAADDAADARGELAPVDRARHDVGRAEFERQHLLDQVGAAATP